VEVKDLLDWLVATDKGAGAKLSDAGSVWVVTSAARYRLLKPAAAYADVFTCTWRRAAADGGRDAGAAKAADAALAAAGVELPTQTAQAARHGMAGACTPLPVGRPGMECCKAQRSKLF
jgi:Cytosine specific DNA methyltransferase replication foci domain